MSSPSSPVTVTIDTTAPLPPVITSPANGTRINNKTPTIQGTAEGGITVVISIDNTSVDTTNSSQNGSWVFSIPLSASLTDGSYIITAKAIDSANNTSPQSSPVLLTVDTIPPRVLDTNPPDQASNVQINEVVKAVFSEPLDPSSFENSTSFTVMDNNGNSVAGDVSLDQDGMKASFHLRFNSSLSYSETYTANVSRRIRDMAGNKLDPERTWTFTTEKKPDVIPPKVVVTDPADNARGIPMNKIIIATFSKEMNPSTMNVDTFTVSERGSTQRIGGAVFRNPDDGKVWKFKPRSSLKEYTAYTAMISKEASDITGNKMDSEYSWIFTTEQITPG
jgi:hypothetical protein